MIKHIVMWKLKDHALGRPKEENANLMKKALEGMQGKIESLRALEVGINFNETDAAYDIALYSEFDDKAGLQAYQVHEEHLKAVEFIRQVRDIRIVTDYEV